MNYTIFDTPVIKTLMYYLSGFILKSLGWRMEGKVPDLPGYVVIAAPHTSNWDFPYTLLLCFTLKMNINWMGKDAIFKFPLGGFFKWLGGIPVDRSKSSGLVESSIKTLTSKNNFGLIIPPSGTRKQVLYWKTGFYHIARGANVPIALGFLDYRLKKGGIGPLIYPTGDLKHDMKEISSFYSGITGRYPEKVIQMHAPALNRPVM